MRTSQPCTVECDIRISLDMAHMPFPPMQACCVDLDLPIRSFLSALRICLVPIQSMDSMPLGIDSLRLVFATL